jgi:hypothetical protein
MTRLCVRRSGLQVVIIGSISASVDTLPNGAHAGPGTTDFSGSRPADR